MCSMAFARDSLPLWLLQPFIASICNAQARLAACVTLACQIKTDTCRWFRSLLVQRDPGRAEGPKNGFLIRVAAAPRSMAAAPPNPVNPCETDCLWSPRVDTIHVQAPTPHTPPLQSFLVDFSQQTTGLAYLAKVCFQGLLKHPPAASMAYAVQALTHYQTYERRPEPI